MFEYEYPHPAVSADVVAVAGPPEARRVLLVRRAAEPFAGRWAIPGGFVNENEPLEAAARRELEEETGLAVAADLTQVGAFGDPGRDPRGWTVSAVFGVVLEGEPPAVAGSDDAAEAAWHRIDALPPLAFDHDLVMRAALERLGV